MHKMHKKTMIAVLAAAGMLAATGAAFADKAGASACAAKLPKNAKLIYDATAAQAAGGGDLKDLVTTQTRGLVMSGQIDRGGAREAAEAAGQCLVMLRS